MKVGQTPTDLFSPGLRRAFGDTRHKETHPSKKNSAKYSQGNIVACSSTQVSRRTRTLPVTEKFTDKFT